MALPSAPHQAYGRRAARKAADRDRFSSSGREPSARKITRIATPFSPRRVPREEGARRAWSYPPYPPCGLSPLPLRNRPPGNEALRELWRRAGCQQHLQSWGIACPYVSAYSAEWIPVLPHRITRQVEIRTVFPRSPDSALAGKMLRGESGALGSAEMNIKSGPPLAWAKSVAPTRPARKPDSRLFSKLRLSVRDQLGTSPALAVDGLIFLVRFCADSQITSLDSGSPGPIRELQSGSHAACQPCRLLGAFQTSC